MLVSVAKKMMEVVNFMLTEVRRGRTKTCRFLGLLRSVRLNRSKLAVSKIMIGGRFGLNKNSIGGREAFIQFSCYQALSRD